MQMPEWTSKRQRAAHVTVRPIDCVDFDVDDMIGRFSDWGVNLFTIFAAGYVTYYPSRYAHFPQCPELQGRDLIAEVLSKARAAGIRCFPAIDLGEVAERVAEAHPEWVARKADGAVFEKSAGIITSCPLGGYVREGAREVVSELVERYGAGSFDGMKWGGASYGFPSGVCHCPVCRERYPAETGQALPERTDEPRYKRWREQMMAETVRHLTDTVHDIAGVPVVGNSVWHLGRGMDIAGTARGEDFSQVEVQTRCFSVGDDPDPCWDRFGTPIETSRYVSSLSARPPWVVSSYFLAWPWRRVAVPVPEQKLYMAQVAANGGSPMVNLTTGAPQHHQDPRGFQALKELFGFMRCHADLYDGDRSAARVALVYDHASALLAQADGDIWKGYVRELHGWQDACEQLHLPFDLIDASELQRLDGQRYAVLLLPGTGGLSDAACAELDRLHAAGVGIVASRAPASRRADGSWRASPLCPLLGVQEIAPEQPFHVCDEGHPCQAYAKISDPAHPLCANIPVPLLALAGHFNPVEPAGVDVSVPLRRPAPFRLFPEGLSYTERPDPDEPLAVCRDPADAGRVVYLPFAVGRAIVHTGHPDNQQLAVDALRWAARDQVRPLLDGFPDVRVSLRRQGARTCVHLINTTGRQRHLTAYTPVHDLLLRIPHQGLPQRVYLAGAGQSLHGEVIDGELHILVPRLVDYDILVIE